MNIDKRMELQRKEFDAADDFANALRAHNMTAVVDDDYPLMRGRYETALARLVEAMKANGRFDNKANHYGLLRLNP